MNKINPAQLANWLNRQTQMKTLVLLRHGESTWNARNLFCGWVDVGLTEKGVQEALEAARLMREGGYIFDVAFTSVLKRAIKTLWIVLEQMDLMWIPVSRSWRLNERHYGALQGFDKVETVGKYGIEQVNLWRRSYDVPPPALSREGPFYPGNDPRYAEIKSDEMPLTECLKDTIDRFLPYWHEAIAPAIRVGKRVLIAAHGNSLRALVKHVDAISDKEIVNLNIPTGIPLVYELDDDFTPIRHFYLGDPTLVGKAVQAVANQLKQK